MSTRVCAQVAEVWDEVTAELELEGVRPVTPDAEALRTISQSSEDKAKHVSSLQQSIVERKEQEDLDQEKHAYEEVENDKFTFIHTSITQNSDCLLLFMFIMQIKLNHKQHELTAKSWEHHIAKTSSYNVLKVCLIQIIHRGLKYYGCDSILLG